MYHNGVFFIALSTMLALWHIQNADSDLVMEEDSEGKI